MICFVYILENSSGKLYIGQTANLPERLKEHNVTGKGYTSKYRPWFLIYKEECKDRKIAMERERFLKTGVGRDWIKINILRA